MASLNGSLTPDAPLVLARCLPKWEIIKGAFKEHSEMWLRGETLDARDQALLEADKVRWINYGQSTYVRSMYHMQRGQDFGKTRWEVEEDEKCKKIIATAGGKLVGFDIEAMPATDFVSTTVGVNIKAAGPGLGWDWGMIGTSACNVRIFRGPSQFCPVHPWDVMILRNCGPHTDGLYGFEPMMSKAWDVFAVKCCEDMDSPWIVTDIRAAGPADQEARQCGCGNASHHNNPADTGCIIAH